MDKVAKIMTDQILELLEIIVDAGIHESWWDWDG